MRRPRPVHLALALSAVAAALLVSSCGGGGSSSTGTEGHGATTEAAGTTTTAARRRITVVSAKLSPGQTIPKGPNGASGSATITLDLNSGQACWRLTVTGTDEPLSAHVHQGLAGKLGDVVIPLGDTFSRKGCVLSGKSALRAVGANPAGFYVDVHTTKFIQGAVRGQLRTGSA